MYKKQKTKNSRKVKFIISFKMSKYHLDDVIINYFIWRNLNLNTACYDSMSK